MSSNSSGPYQSKVLTFISRQSRQWIDQGQQALRHAAIGAAWGLQLVLAPVLWLLQGATAAGQQLQQAVEEKVPQLKAMANLFRTHGAADAPEQTANLEDKKITVPPLPNRTSWPPTSETPIHTILQTVRKFSFPEDLAASCLSLPIQSIQGNAADALTSFNQTLQDRTLKTQLLKNQATSGNLAIVEVSEDSVGSADKRMQTLTTVGCAQPLHTAFPLQIRAIATLLETRKLVLVTEQNLILDILTPDQQQKLHHRIVWETLKYQHYQQVVGTIQKRFERYQKSPLARYLNNLPASQGLSRLTTWFEPAFAQWAQPLFEKILSRLFHLPLASAPQPAGSNSEDPSISSQADETASALPGFKLRIPNFLNADLWQALKPPGALVPLNRVLEQIEIPPFSSAAELSATLADRGQDLLQQVQDGIAALLHPYLSDRSTALPGGQSAASGQTTGLLNAADTPNGFPHTLMLTALQQLFAEGKSLFFNQTSDQSQIPALPEAGNLPADPPFLAAFKALASLLPHRQTQSSSPQAVAPQCLYPQEDDPWLTADDLFSGSSFAAAVAPSTLDPTAANKPLETTLPLDYHLNSADAASLRLPPANWLTDLGQGIRDRIRKTLHHLHSRLSFPQSDAPTVTADADTSQLSTECQPTTPEFTPDWIETPATQVGYIKHPLERLLEWFDRIMFWIEKQIANLWHWLQTR